MSQPAYGYDTKGKPLHPGSRHHLLPEGAPILPKDQPYDIYAGWIQGDGYHARNGFSARSEGRWTAWRRRKAVRQTLITKTPTNPTL